MTRPSSQTADPLRHWSLRDASQLYGVSEWGRDYFTINTDGNLAVTHDEAALDLKLLADDLIRGGIQLPILLRFPELLEARIRLLHDAFADAIGRYGYKSEYRGVYPIKVNQSRRVVEAIVDCGRRFHYGLEAGSKPELLAVMAMLGDEQALVVCNGYKDEDYIETALLASKLGPTVVIVVEKPSELTLIRGVAEALRVKPSLGIRMRLSSRGAGKWEQSGGDQSKFGLSASEILSSIEQLREWDLLPCFELLHFHLGSQITAIQSIKEALREASRMYIELVRLGCADLAYLDVGGGLGVDYDGSQTNFESSMNYSVQEYANDVVSVMADACDAENIRHPFLVTESGRAVVAYHSVLIVNVIGVSESLPATSPEKPDAGAADVAHGLWEVYATVSSKNVRECFHDALEYKEQVLQLFNLGHLSLAQRAHCERLFWAACHKMAGITRTLKQVPEELQVLDRVLCDTYFCNFSMFQSLPDSWAVNQLFPIMPIHRLKEAPSRRAILADITCDSDGKIDSFIDARDVKNTLELHRPDGARYLLGIMLTGAYQEILGDLHNLFGDTNVVIVRLGKNAGDYEIVEVTQGDNVTDVLRYVDYEPGSLINGIRVSIETALKKGNMTLAESKQLMKRYRDGLAAYTYLE